MGKAGRKTAAAVTNAAAAEPEGFKPDASLREVDLAQPRLDVSAAGPGSDQELWLLQLPLEFPADAKVEWRVEQDSLDGFRGRCQVNGVEYLLVPDQQALSADIYATPADPRGKLAPLTRRLTVVRASAAPQLCFGLSEAEAKLAGLVAPGAPGAAGLAGPAGRTAAKRRRAEGSEPAVGAAASGGVQAGAAQQQQQAQQTQQQQQAQQQAGEADGSGKKRKKDKGEKKSAKKEKKRKSEAAEGGADAAAPDAAEEPPVGKSAEKKKAKKEKKEKKKDKS